MRKSKAEKIDSKRKSRRDSKSDIESLGFHKEEEFREFIKFDDDEIDLKEVTPLHELGIFL